MLQVAEGVQYMHYEGVIHCDLHGVSVHECCPFILN
jgi:hypothetical protein